MTKDKETKLKKIALVSRLNILEMVYNAKSGHIGGSYSIIDILTYIYNEKMNKNTKLILSKGHASPALYATLYQQKIIDEISSFRKIGGKLQGHPTNHINGVDISTGSLGQGLSASIGFALAQKLNKNQEMVYCILGDGECQEGQVWEAFLSASKYSLDNLCIIIDCNNLQLDGYVTDIKNIYPLKEKLNGFNLEILEIHGHDFNQIEKAINKKTDKTKVILAKTIKGKGVSFMENNANWHGKAPNKEEYEKAKKELKEQM